MSPTRRDLLRSLAGVAVALPIATLPAIAHATPPAPTAPQTRWNTVETRPVQEGDPPIAWSASAIVVAHSSEGDQNREASREMHIGVYPDGSMRICFCPINPFKDLPVGGRHTAIFIDPEMSAEVWRGLFAKDEADTLPTKPAPPKPWDEAEYRRDQARIGRRRRYAQIEEQFDREARPISIVG